MSLFWIGADDVKGDEWQLRKVIAVGNGVVLVNSKDYTKSVGSLFKDTKKFKSLKIDPTITRKKTLQSYLSTLHKRNELTTEECNAMRPKNDKLARAHGLPKIHKEYNNIPKFRPIVDTTGTPHYSAGKFLTNLLNPLLITNSHWKIHLMQLIKSKIYYLICLMIDTTMYLLIWTLYSQMFPSKEQ